MMNLFLMDLCFFVMRIQKEARICLFQVNCSGNISCLFLQLSVVALNKTTVIPVADEDEDPDYDMTDEFKTSKLAETSTTENVIVPVSVSSTLCSLF